MAQKSGNHVKPPTGVQGTGSAPERSDDETSTEQHHGENTKSLQDDKKISNQGNGAGRPPLMKK